MPAILWPISWILFMVGLWVAFAVVAVKENKARKKAAKELQASRQAMAGVGAEMTPQDAGGFDDGMGLAAGMVDFDENAFK